jgi:virginiamycin B lyase
MKFRSPALPLAAAVLMFVVSVAVQGQAPQGQAAPAAPQGAGREGGAGRQGGAPGGGRGAAVTLPDGAGKELVEKNCATCHGLNLITNSRGHSSEGWQTLFSTMIALPTADATTVSTYLGMNFPAKPGPDAKIIPGAVTVGFREWLLPTLGQRPHDPLAAADGSIWWTGQFAGRIGQISTTEARMREFPLPTADTQAHGLIEDAQGNIWYTAINKGYVGKFDPKTRMVQQVAVPMPASNPHTPIIDQKGMLWFTTQSGHVGRINTANNEIRVQATPSMGTYPYGIQVAADGTPWYVDFRGPRLGKVDPNTMAITEITLPNAESRPRRIAITADGAIWYTDYPRGKIGRYDPATQQFREFDSPSGPQSLPYGIAAVGNIVWYSESGVRPNTLVRFDPTANLWQTWAIPSGGGIVRHMMADRRGNIVMAESGVNRVALATVIRP